MFPERRDHRWLFSWVESIEYIQAGYSMEFTGFPDSDIGTETCDYICWMVVHSSWWRCFGLNLMANIYSKRWKVLGSKFIVLRQISLCTSAKKLGNHFFQLHDSFLYEEFQS